MSKTQNVTYSANASLSVSGVTPNPLTAPTQSLTISAPYAVSKQAVDDYLSRNYTVNAATTATVLDLGLITEGEVLMLTTTGTIMLTITQLAGDVVIQVDDFIMLSSAFSALKVANAGGTAVQISLAVLGNRPAIGGSGGVF